MLERPPAEKLTEAKREKCINGGYATGIKSIWEFAKGGFEGENTYGSSNKSTSQANFSAFIPETLSG